MLELKLNSLLEFLETERCYLKPMCLEDVDFIKRTLNRHYTTLNFAGHTWYAYYQMIGNISSLLYDHGNLQYVFDQSIFYVHEYIKWSKKTFKREPPIKFFNLLDIKEPIFED